ncbi:MAG: hypothetical protein M0C28_19385, partial [Candidatus Moduliflexus flocculans]|nr:hypothetical protein [Candidatus Moduliflexus flocculans]
MGDSEFKLIDHTPGYGSVARYWALNRPERERGERAAPARPTRCSCCRRWGARSASSRRPRAWPIRSANAAAD